MKSFLIFILSLILIFIGLQYLIVDNGYVLIEFFNYSIETSVPIFLGALIVHVKETRMKDAGGDPRWCLVRSLSLLYFPRSYGWTCSPDR